MRDRLKRLREAATRAFEAARTGPADTLKNVTEGMLKRATTSGVPTEVATAGSAAAAGLWAKVSPDDPLAQARLAEAFVRDGRFTQVIELLTVAEDDAREAALLAQAWRARAEASSERRAEAIRRIERVSALLPTADSEITDQTRGALASAALDALRVDLARTISARPATDPLLTVARGRIALVEGEHTKALTLLDEAAASAIDEAVAWRAIALARAGQPRQATARLGDMRTQGPERIWIDLTLAWLQLVEGSAAARSSLEKVAEHAPGHPTGHYLLGILAEREQRYDEGQVAFRRAAELAPQWSAPWFGLVRTAMAAGDYLAARDAARQTGSSSENALLQGLAAGLSGDMATAEELWEEAAAQRSQRRDVAMLRGAVAWQLTSKGALEAASAAWRNVGRAASHAGSSRYTLARWAIDGARRCLEKSQPPYYLIEAALSAAAALRPESEDLVVGSCSASFLARGPAAARTSLEAAVNRGAADERVTSLIGLIDAATRGAPAPAPAIRQGQGALEAANLARQGDAAGCLELLDSVEAGSSSAAVSAVVRGARSLAELSRLDEVLRRGDLDEAHRVITRALEHHPAGLDRDRLIHDQAAVCTIASRRSDVGERESGEVPSQQTLIWWQEALRGWSALASASAYWADLSRRVMEYDDPRVTPRDVDALRARVHEVAAELPASMAREAVAAGKHPRARAFIALLVGAPFADDPKRRALEEALRPLTSEIHDFADETKKAARELDEQELAEDYLQRLSRLKELRKALTEVAPASVAPARDAHDELALTLVTAFENLHDRAREYRTALKALAVAVETAASETLRAELQGKLDRMRSKT